MSAKSVCVCVGVCVCERERVRESESERERESMWARDKTSVREKKTNKENRLSQWLLNMKIFLLLNH